MGGRQPRPDVALRRRVTNWDPIWPGHAGPHPPGPSSMWFDGAGRRLPAPLLPGYDTLGTLEHLRHTGFDHSWFITNTSIAGLGIRPRAVSRTSTSPTTDRANWQARFGMAGRHPRCTRRSRSSSTTASTSSADTVAELVGKMKLPPRRPARRSRHRAPGPRPRRPTRQRLRQGRRSRPFAPRANYVADKVSKRAHLLVKITDPKHGPRRRPPQRPSRKTPRWPPHDLSGPSWAPTAHHPRPVCRGRGQRVRRRRRAWGTAPWRAFVGGLPLHWAGRGSRRRPRRTARVRPRHTSRSASRGTGRCRRWVTSASCPRAQQWLTRPGRGRPGRGRGQHASAAVGPGPPSAAPRGRSGCRGRGLRASRRAGPGRCATPRRWERPR